MPTSRAKWLRVPAGTHTNAIMRAAAADATSASDPSPPATPRASAPSATASWTNYSGGSSPVRVTGSTPRSRATSSSLARCALPPPEAGLMNSTGRRAASTRMNPDGGMSRRCAFIACLRRTARQRHNPAGRQGCQVRGRSSGGGVHQARCWRVRVLTAKSTGKHKAQLGHHLESDRSDHPLPRQPGQAVRRELQTGNQPKQKVGEHRIDHDLQRRSAQTALRVAERAPAVVLRSELEPRPDPPPPSGRPHSQRRLRAADHDRGGVGDAIYASAFPLRA